MFFIYKKGLTILWLIDMQTVVAAVLGSNPASLPMILERFRFDVLCTYTFNTNIHLRTTDIQHIIC